jgi:hypothetical protein
MELLISRTDATVARTIGQLFVDGRFEMFTLEPALVRLAPALEHPAIPAARYLIDITASQRFGRMLPLVSNVPGRSGIRIHCGNVADDTSGCILVGYSRAHDSVVSSKYEGRRKRTPSATWLVRRCPGSRRPS